MDTAQLAGAAETDPNVAIANAADAFKSATSPPVARDELGQFAARQAAEPEPEEAEEELETQQAEDPDEGYEEDEQEAAQEAQPMPPSWSGDKADIWKTLPVEAQAYIAERETERDRAVNAKFQESANVRKAAEAEAEQARITRSQYAQVLDGLMQSIQPQRPLPQQYGAGTGQYDRESYDLACAQYDMAVEAYNELHAQRSAITDQESAEAQARMQQTYQQVETSNREYAPEFLADIPEAADPVKATAVFESLFQYAMQHGIAPELLQGENVKLIPLSQAHIIWKAQQYDKLKAAPQAAKPKPAGPAVRPGVSSPRSAQKTAQRQKAMDRLNRDGSVEAGAAVFRNLFK